ncbi:MAG: S-adenosyl-methyltransferase MraW [uncultured bacterium]|nr:MAG: S-adenosyl-methyltransferase MraW [uncultured bacterium]
MQQNYHTPVLLKEVLEALQIKADGKYIDCTLGDGGHTLEILKLGGHVLGIDIDETAGKRALGRIQTEGLAKNFTLAHGNFANIEKIASENGFEQVNGILFDLGYSSYQLTREELGLSFLEDQPLDMRLDKTLGVTAADLVNALPAKDLAHLFFEYSDERMANRFAKAIVEARSLKKFNTTKDLSDLLASVAPPGYEHGRIHPATRVFQALRIAVNGEIDNLKNSLPRAARLLLPGGRMTVISFHSLEDKTVKQFGRGVRACLKVVTEKPLVPSEEEVLANARSRSAKLRVFEKE